MCDTRKNKYFLGTKTSLTIKLWKNGKKSTGSQDCYLDKWTDIGTIIRPDPNILGHLNVFVGHWPLQACISWGVDVAKSPLFVVRSWQHTWTTSWTSCSIRRTPPDWASALHSFIRPRSRAQASHWGKIEINPLSSITKKNLVDGGCVRQHPSRWKGRQNSQPEGEGGSPFFRNHSAVHACRKKSTACFLNELLGSSLRRKGGTAESLRRTKAMVGLLVIPTRGPARCCWWPAPLDSLAEIPPLSTAPSEVDRRAQEFFWAGGKRGSDPLLPLPPHPPFSLLPPHQSTYGGTSDNQKIQGKEYARRSEAIRIRSKQKSLILHVGGFGCVWLM